MVRVIKVGFCGRDMPDGGSEMACEAELLEAADLLTTRVKYMSQN